MCSCISSFISFCTSHITLSPTNTTAPSLSPLTLYHHHHHPPHLLPTHIAVASLASGAHRRVAIVARRRSVGARTQGGADARGDARGDGEGGGRGGGAREGAAEHSTCRGDNDVEGLGREMRDDKRQSREKEIERDVLVAFTVSDFITAHLSLTISPPSLSISPPPISLACS